MLINDRSVGASLFFGSAVWLISLQPAAADLLTQAPCEYSSGRCIAFDPSTAPIPVVRSFTFDVVGKALVRFDGTMQCVVSSTVNNQDVIDLASQIVFRPEDTPDYSGPGGGRFAMRLHMNSGAIDSSGAVNLSSSRLIEYKNPGQATVYFKIAQLRMDPGTNCSVLSAAFSVITSP